MMTNRKCIKRKMTEEDSSTSKDNKAHAELSSQLKKSIDNGPRDTADTDVVPCEPLPQKPFQKSFRSLAMGQSQLGHKTGKFAFQQRPLASPTLGSIGQVRSQQRCLINPTTNVTNLQANAMNRLVKLPNKVSLSLPQTVLDLQQSQHSKFALKLMKTPSKTTRPSPSHVLRYWTKDQKVNLLSIPASESNIKSYNLIITEDINNFPPPTRFFGPTEGIDKQIYTLVQFEGHPYVDIVSTFQLYKQFPDLEDTGDVDLQTDIVTVTAI